MAAAPSRVTHLSRGVVDGIMISSLMRHGKIVQPQRGVGNFADGLFCGEKGEKVLKIGTLIRV